MGGSTTPPYGSIAECERTTPVVSDYKSDVGELRKVVFTIILERQVVWDKLLWRIHQNNLPALGDRRSGLGEGARRA